MTDQELKDLVASIAIMQAENQKAQAENQKVQAEYTKSQAEYAKRSAKYDEEYELLRAKNEKRFAKTEALLSNIGHNNGDYAEDYFYNSLSDTMLFAGIKYDTISKNIHIKRHRLEDEFDIVMYNGNSIALIECKYKAHENDLKKLVEKKVSNFRELNPDYASYKIYCGLGSFSFYTELEEQALAMGVAVLKQKGDVMEVNASTVRAY